MELKSNQLMIYVIGLTASGKSLLSIELAKKFQGEIVNADAIQLYSGLDVMSAKATQHEQNTVKHHLLDILQINQKNYMRPDYIQAADTAIQNIQNSNKIPIIVGGTNYYIEGVMYNVQNEYVNDQVTDKFTKDKNDNIDKSKYTYEALKQVDPEMAQKIHPNDYRRITTYLRMYEELNIKPSDILMSQSKKLKYENSIIIWVYLNNNDEFEKGVRKRIDDMLYRGGGIKDVVNVLEQLVDDKYEVDDTFGALHGIGYKEFIEFYKQISLQNIKHIFKQDFKSQEQIINTLKQHSDGDQLYKIFEQCKDLCIKNTIKYSKQQLKWIKNRFLYDEVIQDCLYIFSYDQYDKSVFESEVLDKAFKLVQDKLNNKQFILTEYLVRESQLFKDLISKGKQFGRKLIEKDYQYCQICQKYYSNPQELELHNKNKKHLKKVKQTLKASLNSNQIEKNYQMITKESP